MIPSIVWNIICAILIAIYALFVIIFYVIRILFIKIKWIFLMLIILVSCNGNGYKFHAVDSVTILRLCDQPHERCTHYIIFTSMISAKTVLKDCTDIKRLYYRLAKNYNVDLICKHNISYTVLETDSE